MPPHNPTDSQSQGLRPKRVVAYRRDVWSRLKANGYDVIPLVDGKARPSKSWPTMPNTEADINAWNGCAAAVRMFGSELLVIDLDIRIKSVCDAVLAMIEQRWPEFAAQCLRRHSQAVKLALIGRAPHAEKRTMNTLSFYPDPEVLDKEQKCQVEVFTRNSKRYVGVHGAHSIGREYGYHGRTILDVKIDELPLFPDDEIGAMLNACETIMKQCGLFAPRHDQARGDASVVYDLQPDMVFKLKDGTQLTLDKLEEEVEAYGKQEGYPSFIDPASGSCDRIKANISKTGLALYDTKTETSHRWADQAPQPDLIAEQLHALMGERLPPAPSGRPRPAESASVADKAQWLLQNYGYCALTDSVVDIYNPGDDCSIKPVAYTRLYRAWREPIKSKKDAKKDTVKFAYATGYWEVNPRRIDIKGVRLRPDQPFPLYTEQGQTYKNTYLRPRHEGNGDIQPWLDFMVHLLPDAAEREWFCNWLAHKYRHPGIPGVAVIMVAANQDGPVYGAGRGILRDIIARLLGPKYVRAVDFDMFSGHSGQSVYTDWAAYAVLVTVSEAKDTPDSGRWAARRAVYERIKELVDPRAVERMFVGKYTIAFSSLAFAGYLIFSNNRDAMQIPDGDRRITALANGTQMAPSMAAGLQAWMEQPGNIAALAQWLDARDLFRFDAYTPLGTQTKTIMQELARSDLDDAFLAVRRKIGPRGLFTGELIRSAVSLEMGDITPGEDIKRATQRWVRAEAMQVASFRVLRSQGDHKILQWRGSDSAWVTDEATARAAVANTAKVAGLAGYGENSKWTP